MISSVQSCSRLLVSRPTSIAGRLLLPATRRVQYYSSETTVEPVDPKITQIVNSIATLNLLETAALVKALKTKLNITDIAMPMMAAMPAGAAAVNGSAAAASEAPVEEEKPKEKTIFTVKLEKFDAAAKAKIIREIKALIPGMNLVEAKKFVESVPKTVKENVPKEEAEKMKRLWRS